MACSFWPDRDLKACCVQHDIEYRLCRITRAQADRHLRECVKRKGHPVQAWVIWFGVRLFGWARWGA